MKVLVIGDNEVVEDISFYLQLRWPHVITVSAAEGSKGIELVEAEAPDLVMADFSLPDMNGVDLASRICEFSDVPLIILMEREPEMERARVLEVGADDYITKPLSAIDVLAKVNALLRRTHAVGFQRGRMPLVSGDLTINLSTHEVFLSGKPLKLTPLEYGLLRQLARNEGQVLTHRMLLEKVWGPEYAEDCGLIKKYIYSLRRKLSNDAAHPRRIVTVRGMGYKFPKHA